MAASLARITPSGAPGLGHGVRARPVAAAAGALGAWPVAAAAGDADAHFHGNYGTRGRTSVPPGPQAPTPLGRCSRWRGGTTLASVGVPHFGSSAGPSDSRKRQRLKGSKGANLNNEDGQAARHVGIADDSVMACPAAGEAVPGASRARRAKSMVTGEVEGGAKKRTRTAYQSFYAEKRTGSRPSWGAASAL